MAARNLDWHVALTGECMEMGRVSRDGTIARSTGQGEHPLTEGRPLIASGETAERTLGRIQRLSKQFGTEMTVDGGIGLIRLRSDA